MYVSNIFVLDKGGRCTRRRCKAIFLIKLRVVASQDMMRITTWAAKVFASFEKKKNYLPLLTKNCLSCKMFLDRKPVMILWWSGCNRFQSWHVYECCLVLPKGQVARIFQPHRIVYVSCYINYFSEIGFYFFTKYCEYL